MRLVLHCADIGSVKKGNFGWARLSEDAGATCSTGRDIGQFVERVADDLNAGAHVALGFECPLFVPLSKTRPACLVPDLVRATVRGAPEPEQVRSQRG